MTTTNPTAVRSDWLERLRAELTEQRAARLAQIGELTGSGVAGAPPADLAEAANLARQAIAEIDAALARIDAGEYGKCGSCGGPIPEQRLEVLPAAALCLPCRRGHERRYR